VLVYQALPTLTVSVTYEAQTYEARLRDPTQEAAEDFCLQSKETISMTQPLYIMQAEEHILPGPATA